ncbi:MAG: class C sortase [Oscillospiraceae bacterium]|nr:class C sortase [Oscillospiraceae bacterium]
MRRKQEHTAVRKRDRVWTIVLVCAFVVGLSVLLYPTFSNWWNTRGAKRIIAEYNAAVEEMQEEDYSDFFVAANAYNQALAEIGTSTALVSPELVEGYEETLDITGTGIMGYIFIEKIDVELPIYHGTSDGVLQIAVGHLEGTSLPVGGESTHCVLSAHRGLPSARLFTDLDQMEVGDIFTITVLDQVLTYEVDQITIVLPDDVEDLYIEEGKDYCTLMTCTPYGVNTHRLLVRGVRVANQEGALIHVTAEAYKIDTVVTATVVAVPLLLGLLVWLLVSTRRKKRK